MKAEYKYGGRTLFLSLLFFFRAAFLRCTLCRRRLPSSFLRASSQPASFAFSGRSFCLPFSPETYTYRASRSLCACNDIQETYITSPTMINYSARISSLSARLRLGCDDERQTTTTTMQRRRLQQPSSRSFYGERLRERASVRNKQCAKDTHTHTVY